MFEKEMADLKEKLTAIGAGATPRPPSWHDTKIGRWPSDGMLREVEDKRAPEWWKRSNMGGENHLSSINELLKGAGIGRLTRYDSDFEERRDAHKKQNKKYDEAADELDPGEEETIADWIGRLGIHVDSTDPFFMALRSHAARFRGDAVAKKTLDSKMLQSFLDKFKSRKAGKQ